MKFARVGAAIAAAAIVVTACGGTASSGKDLKIGITLPLSGSAAASAAPAQKGAALAIKEFKLDGYTVTTSVLDHAVNGVHDPQQGAKDMTTLVSDPAVIGAVGPFNSSVAKVQIPISNEAGLFQCSPANTNPDLTKGDAGKELRAKNPDKINYVRVATTDDIQGPAVAQYGINTLGLKSVAIIDDTETYGKGIADAFAAEWEKLGGTVVGREGAPKDRDRALGGGQVVMDVKPAHCCLHGGPSSRRGGEVGAAGALLIACRLPRVSVSQVRRPCKQEFDAFGGPQ